MNTITINVADKDSGYRYTLAPTGKVIAVGVGSDPALEVDSDLTILGFTKNRNTIRDVRVDMIDHTVDDLFHGGLTVLASFPIMRTYDAVYIYPLPVKSIEPSYVPKHRKEGVAS